MSHTNIDTFPNTRVFLSNSGEFVLALPIYAEGVESDLTHMTIELGDNGVQVNYLGHIGYIVYHPEFGEMVFNSNVTDLFEDLGTL